MSWEAFGPSWSPKVATGGEGEGEEGKRSERRGKRCRIMDYDVLARGAGEVQPPLSSEAIVFDVNFRIDF